MRKALTQAVRPGCTLHLVMHVIREGPTAIDLAVNLCFHVSQLFSKLVQLEAYFE